MEPENVQPKVIDEKKTARTAQQFLKRYGVYSNILQCSTDEQQKKIATITCERTKRAIFNMNTDEYATILNLTYIDPQTIEEVAQLLALPERTLYDHKQKALVEFAKAYEAHSLLVWR